MRTYYARHEIAALEVVSIQEINQVYERRLENDRRYRFVIDLASLNSGAP